MPSKAPAAATDARAPPPPACAARLAPRLGCESQLLCQTNAPHRWAFPPSDYIGPDDHRETDDLARVSAGGNALQLNFVFGYTGRRVRQNLFYNADGRLVYHTAAVGVVYDKERHAQVSDPPPPRRRTRPLLAVPRPRLAPSPPPCPPTPGLRRSDLGAISPAALLQGPRRRHHRDGHPPRPRPRRHRPDGEGAQDPRLVVAPRRQRQSPAALLHPGRPQARDHLPLLLQHRRAIAPSAPPRRRDTATPRHRDTATMAAAVPLTVRRARPRAAQARTSQRWARTTTG